MVNCGNSFCGKTIDEQSDHYYTGYNHQKGYETVLFCSKECLKSWIKRKLSGMISCLVIGLILAVLEPDLGYILLFVPYMLRQCWSLLTELFDGGTIGEILSFAIVLLGAITVVYPLYKMVRETIYYVRTLRELA